MDLEEQLESLIPAALCNGDGAQTLAELARSSYRAELMTSWTQDAGEAHLDSHAVHDIIVGDPTLEERVRERPLLSLGLASVAGFILGGGASSRGGAAILMLIARIWLRRAATEALTDALSNYGAAKRNGPG